MREIRREWHEEEGIGFEVFATDIANHNILEVAAGSTGPNRLDKWDVKTYIRIRDAGGTCMKIDATKDAVEIKFQGGAELETLIGGLEFMLQALKDANEEMYYA